MKKGLILILFIIVISAFAVGCKSEEDKKFEQEMEQLRQEAKNEVDEKFCIKEETQIDTETAQYKQALFLMVKLTAESADNFSNLALKTKFQDNIDLVGELEGITSTYTMGFEAFQKIKVPDNMRSSSIHKKAMIIFEFFYEHFNFMLLALGEEDADSFVEVMDSYSNGDDRAMETIEESILPYLDEK